MSIIFKPGHNNNLAFSGTEAVVGDKVVGESAVGEVVGVLVGVFVGIFVGIFVVGDDVVGEIQGVFQYGQDVQKHAFPNLVFDVNERWRGRNSGDFKMVTSQVTSSIPNVTFFDKLERLVVVKDSDTIGDDQLIVDGVCIVSFEECSIVVAHGRSVDHQEVNAGIVTNAGTVILQLSL